MFRGQLICCAYAAGSVASLTVVILKLLGPRFMERAEIVELAFYISMPNFCFINALYQLYNGHVGKRVRTYVPQRSVAGMRMMCGDVDDVRGCG